MKRVKVILCITVILVGCSSRVVPAPEERTDLEPVDALKTVHQFELPKLPLPPSEFMPYGFQVSPDGRIFTAKHGQGALYVWQEGDPLATALGYSNDPLVVWAGDGFYFSHEDRILFYRPGEPTPITVIEAGQTEGWVRVWGWHDAAEQLIYSDDRGLKALDPGGITPLGLPLGRLTAFSPDGSRYVTWDNETAILVDIDKQVVTPLPALEGFPELANIAWEPGGQRLALNWRNWREGKIRAAIIGLAGAEPVVEQVLPGLTPVFMGDELFVMLSGELIAHSLVDGSERKLGFPKIQRLLGDVARGRIYDQMDPSTYFDVREQGWKELALPMVPPPEQVWISHMGFRPDGGASLVQFYGPPEGLAIWREGEAEPTIIADVWAPHFAWLPDGVAWLGDGILDYRWGAAEPSRMISEGLTAIGWHAPSQSLVVLDQQGPVFLRPDGRVERVFGLPLPYPLVGEVFSPDGDAYVTLADGGLAVVRLSTEEIIPLPAELGAEDYLAFVRWSPSGKKVGVEIIPDGGRFTLIFDLTQEPKLTLSEEAGLLALTEASAYLAAADALLEFPFDHGAPRRLLANYKQSRYPAFDSYNNRLYLDPIDRGIVPYIDLKE